MRISVVIPAYRHDDAVLEHLAACARVQRKPDEVIVVNDGGPHGLSRMMKPAGAGLAAWPWRLVYVRVMEDIPWNQPGARNAGAAVSTGDVLSFEDVDHDPTPLFYDRAAAAFEADPGVVMVRTKRMGEERCCPGSWLVRRTTFWAVGGYDEDFSRGYGCDDCDARRRILKAGAEVIIPDGFTVTAVHGTRGLSRDTTRNRALEEEKRPREKNVTGILRFPMSISVINAGVHREGRPV